MNKIDKLVMNISKAFSGKDGFAARDITRKLIEKEFKNKKTPRQFRNDIYEYLAGYNVTENIAACIADEAEMWIDVYEAYQLRGIEVAMKDIGLKVAGEEDKIKGGTTR